MILHTHKIHRTYVPPILELPRHQDGRAFSADFSVGGAAVGGQQEHGTLFMLGHTATVRKAILGFQGGSLVARENLRPRQCAVARALAAASCLPAAARLSWRT